MFVYISKVETGGRIWNVAINRLLSTVILMQLMMILTIGLQFRFRSLQWLSTVPPILIILAFKVSLNSTFDKAFRYYIPTQDELRQAKVHSEGADHSGHRLERRFGHPALHAELFTPMLHAKMMPLLAQVYEGRIDKDYARLDEYGGQKMEAQIVPGGIKIAAINQRDLEYDPQLYQRDRGELDWDARSVASGSVLGHHGTPSTSTLKGPFYANPQSSMSAVPGYNGYLAHGPGVQSDIELNQLRYSQDNLPLLNHQQQQVHHYQQSSGSPYHSPQQGSQVYRYPPSQGASPMIDPTMPPSMHQMGDGDGGSRGAPVHRPSPISRQSSAAWQSPPPQQDFEPNMAGRGTFRR
jgi:hypothetical protein